MDIEIIRYYIMHNYRLIDASRTLLIRTLAINLDDSTSRAEFLAGKPRDMHPFWIDLHYVNARI